MKTTLAFFILFLLLQAVPAISCKLCSEPQSIPTMGISAASAADADATVKATSTHTGGNFDPPSITIKVGQTVKWIVSSDSELPHWISNDPASDLKHEGVSGPEVFDSGLLKPGDSFSHTFNKAGVYKYVCPLHAGMTGEIDAK